MSEAEFFINHCEACKGGIEFPANGVGDQISCPHCKQSMTLRFPTASDSNPTDQLAQFLAVSAFPNRRDQLRLLSKFISPDEVGNPFRLEYWKTILSNPLEVIDRFISEGLRICASMMFLWGTNKPPRWLQEYFPSSDCDWELEGRMLLFAAAHITNLESIKQAGIHRVRILSSNDPSDCSVCRSDSEKIYPIDSCPILPHEKCTCEMGCRCIATASG